MLPAGVSHSRDGIKNVARRRPGVVLGLLLVAAAGHVQAAPTIYTQGGLNPTGTAYEGVLYQFGTDTISATHQYEFLAEGASENSYFDGSIEARAGFGELGVKAAANLTAYRPGTYQVDETSPIPFPAYAMAGFTDTLTVDGGSGDGLLVFDFAITGSVTNGEFMGNGVIPTLEVNGSRVRLTPLALTGNGSAVSDPFAFTFGTPFDIQVEFLGNVFVLDLFATDPYSTSGTADFVHTLVLSAIVPTTIGGDPLDGVSVRSESGTAYPVASTPVPAPGSLALLALGLVFPVAIVRRTGRRHPPRAGLAGM